MTNMRSQTRTTEKIEVRRIIVGQIKARLEGPGAPLARLRDSAPWTQRLTDSQALRFLDEFNEVAFRSPTMSERRDLIPLVRKWRGLARSIA